MRTHPCWRKHDDSARPLCGVDHGGNFDRARCRLGDRMASRLAQTMIWCADGAGAHATRGVGRIVPATVPPAVTGRAAEARREEPPTRVRARRVNPSAQPRTLHDAPDLLTPHLSH